MSTHAPIAPSSLALTVACNASVQLQQQAPEVPETEQTLEGTAAHLVAMKHAAGFGNTWVVGYVFSSGGRNWTVDVDMFNGAKLYARTIGPDCRLEDAVRASRIHPEHCYGTPDAWKFFDAGATYSPIDSAQTARLTDGHGRAAFKTVRLPDYKYGHLYVEVFENFQLIGYLVGVLERLNLFDDDVMCEFCLIQPRAYHAEGAVRTWYAWAWELRALVNIAEAAAHASLAPDPIATTGRHCINCTARHACKTLMYTTANIVDFSERAELAVLSDESLGQELRLLDAALERLKGRRTGIAAHVESALRAGKRVPFYEMAPGQSRLKWNEATNSTDLAIMADMFGVNIRKPLEVITPTQAIAAGIDASVIGGYSSRPPAAMSLQPTSTTNIRKALGAVK